MMFWRHPKAWDELTYDEQDELYDRVAMYVDLQDYIDQRANWWVREQQVRHGRYDNLPASAGESACRHPPWIVCACDGHVWMQEAIDAALKVGDRVSVGCVPGTAGLFH